MPEVEKFMFDTSFDAPPPAPEPEVVLEDVPAEPPPPPPPMFSEDELRAAQASAHAEGLSEGLKQGRAAAMAENESSVAAVLQGLSAQVAHILAEQSAQVDQSRQMTLDIALAITRKLLPDYIARHGLGEIEAAVRTVMDGLVHEPRLVVRVAEAQLDAVTAGVQQEVARRGFEGKLVFLADPTMGLADCRVEWAEGGVERDASRVWSEVDRLVAEVVKGIGA